MESSEKNSGKTAVLKVAIETPLGPIRSEVAVEIGPMRLAELVPSALELTEIMVGRSKKREQTQGRQISCGPACDVCCRQLVPVSIPEALMIQDLPNSFAPKVRGAFMERFEKISEALKSWKKPEDGQERKIP